MVPTLLAMAGTLESQSSEFAGRELPGQSLMPVLGNPASADFHAAREGILFTYSGLSTVDAGLFAAAGEAIAAGKNPAEELKKTGYRPDLKKRGNVRTIFDGRYKFSRYFAPVDRNKPENMDDLYKFNDVELFDLQADPSEGVNLATDQEKNRDLIGTMSGKLEALIKAEIGKDDGREMPEVAKITWTIDRADL
jgi:arylsulfatase